MSGTGHGQPEAQRLTGHLRLPGATALAITIVVGSGALVIPGLAYATVGNRALLAWAAAAFATVPLLVIFARLGSRYPGAGGVAGFVQHAFGRRAAAAVETTLMGTFGLGIPGIAVTGGNYLGALLGLGQGLVVFVSLGMLLTASAIVYVGVRVSTRIEIVLAVVLTITLVAIGLAAVFAGRPLEHLPSVSAGSLFSGMSALGIVYFAFTGWEMLSFTTEEFVNPRRDFPRVVVISFVVVAGMYLLLSWGIQTQLSSDDPATRTAPLQAVAEALGLPLASRAIAAICVVAILANLVGAVWGASRLVMSSARQGLLPSRVATLDARGNPRMAVLLVTFAFATVVVSQGVGWVSLENLLTIAGKNFFIVYLAAAVAYTWLFPRHRVFGAVISVALGALAVLTFGPVQLGYAALLAAVGVCLASLPSRGPRADAPPASSSLP